jgi:hypothetical protein
VHLQPSANGSLYSGLSLDHENWQKYIVHEQEGFAMVWIRPSASKYILGARREHAQALSMHNLQSSICMQGIISG